MNACQAKALSPAVMRNPFRYFNSSLEVICLAVTMHIRYPLSLRQSEKQPRHRGHVAHQSEDYQGGKIEGCELLHDLAHRHALDSDRYE